MTTKQGRGHAGSGPSDPEQEPGIDDTGPVTTNTQPQQAQPPADGWVIGERYRVLGRLGAGGMAEVLRAHDEMLARDVAVKVFRTQQVPDGAAGFERQKVELHALARLNHPNLITLFDGSITADGRAYLVMELVEGPSLADRIAADGPLPEPAVRELGVQIGSALAYVHAAGMVHRDLKPANILLGTDSATSESTVRARLSDFGIVRLLGTERMTSVDLTLGTAAYLAPEQARSSDVEPAADVYSLALVLLEALTGARAFTETGVDALMARLDRSPHVPPDLPAPWPALLTAMTAMDPAARPTADQVATQLRNTSAPFVPAALRPVPPIAVPVPLPDPEPRRTSPDSAPRFGIGLLVGLIVLAIVLVGALAVLLRPGTGSKGPASTSAPPPTTSRSHTSRQASPPVGPAPNPATSGRASASTSSRSAPASTSASRSASSTPPSSTASRSTSATRSSPPPSSSTATSASASSASASSSARSGTSSGTSTAAGSTTATSTTAAAVGVSQPSGTIGAWSTSVPPPKST